MPFDPLSDDNNCVFYTRLLFLFQTGGFKIKCVP